MAAEKIRAIVIDVVKHSDKSNVVTLYTQTHGRVAFISPAGSGKSGRSRNARLMPLSVINTEIRFNPERELQMLGQISPARIWSNLYFNPIKSSVALFLTEFLNRFLRATAPDKSLFRYIEESVAVLDNSDRGLVNFHISFLIGLLSFAGIEPDLSDISPGDWLDMREGTAVANRPPHNDYISPEYTGFLPTLRRLNYRTSHLFRFPAARRREILEYLLKYFAIHYPGVASLKSLGVLTEVFNS